MELSIWAAIFFAIALVLFVLEVFLPSHGLLGLLSTTSMIACIVTCFRINQTLGLWVMLGALVAAPFLAIAAVKIWPYTPVGRRMMLQPTASRVVQPSLTIGAIGTAMSELRPMGTCDFDGERTEVRSQLGLIATGSKVKIVAIESGRLIVKQIDNQERETC